MNNTNVSNQIKTPAHRRHYGFVILACCCLIMGVNVGLSFSCAGIMYEPVCSSIGVKVGEFGMYMSLMYVASSLLLPWAGRMIEKHSARWLLTGSSALMGVAFLAMALFNNVWEFYGAGIVLGVSVAFLLYLSFPVLINRWFSTRVGLLMGVCAAASGVGGVLFNPLAGYIITNFGWRYTYGVYAAIVLVIVTPVLALLLRDRPSDMGLEPYRGTSPKQPQATESAKPVPAADVAYKDALRMPALYMIVAFSFLMMAISTLNLYVPTFTMSLDFGIEEASLAAASVMVGVTLGKLVLGYINDRSCVAGVLVTTLSGALGLLLMLAGSFGFWLVCLGGFLFGWAYAGVMVQTAMLTRTVFGSRDYARIYAIVSIALAAGGAIASGAWGWIVEATSCSTVFVIGIVLLIVSTVTGLIPLRGHSK